MELSEMTEQQVLDALLAAKEWAAPEQTVTVKRLGIPIKLRGLREDQIERLRAQATHRKSKKSAEEWLDQEEFGLLLLAAATISPDWGDEKLLQHYQASGPDQVIKHVLLPGEIARISDIVLDLSGYGEDAVEEVKNE